MGRNQDLIKIHDKILKKNLSFNHIKIFGIDY